MRTGLFGQFHLSPQEMEPLGFSPQALSDSLDMLDSLHYIAAIRTVSGMVSAFSITVWGFEQYARASVPEYDRTVERVAFYAANQEGAESHGMAAALRVPHTVACHALLALEQKGLVTLGLSSSTALRAEGKHGQALGRRVIRISPQLKRTLQERG